MTETARGVYQNLWNELMEAAEPNYIDYLTGHFLEPDEVDWDSDFDVAVALGSLINEVYESCDDADEVMDDAGHTPELEAWMSEARSQIIH